MIDQLNTNTNTKTKQAKVYCKVEIYSKDFSVCLFESEEMPYNRACSVYAALLASEEYLDAVKQLVRYQRGGAVGGIIIQGSREVIQNVCC